MRDPRFTDGNGGVVITSGNGRAVATGAMSDPIRDTSGNNGTIATGAVGDPIRVTSGNGGSLPLVSKPRKSLILLGVFGDSQKLIWRSSVKGKLL